MTYRTSFFWCSPAGSYSPGPSRRTPLDHKDNAPNRIKCIAEPGYWISWTEPEFFDLTRKRRQYGGNGKMRGFAGIGEEKTVLPILKER